MWQRFALVGLLLVGLFLLMAGTDWAQDAKVPKESPFRTPEYQYVGVSQCKMCHSKEKMGGEEYLAWEKMGHANAFKTLSNEQSMAIAKEKGIADPTKAPECLKCHVTAFGVDEKFVGSKLTQEEGVSCEACHGPGEKYKSMKVMKSHEESVANGLVVPNEKTCVACHNPESPTYKEFDFKKAKEAIKHWKDAE
jgi:mono/diheme cytochrome c family protein